MEDARTTKAAELFFSYSHKDEKLRDELAKHLKLLERQGVLSSWHDRQIGAGQDWKNEIDEHVQNADVILLLISPDFLASDYCFDIEMKAALQRHDKGDALVIPIILRPVDWQSAPFVKLQALPKSGKPVTLFDNRDLAFKDIEAGIRRAVQARFSAAPPVAEQGELRHEWTAQAHPGKINAIKILLVDDHTIVRQGLKFIMSAQPDLRVVGEAGNGTEAIELAQKLKPDVVLMDLAMPQLNGIDATRKMMEENPEVRVLALSMLKETVWLREILKAGARGYILKDAIDTELLTAVRSVARGEGYISPAVSGALLSDYRQNLVDSIDLLSSREREVLRLIAEGKTNKEIAKRLNLSVYTVDSHRGKIMEKLKLASTGELVRFAREQGLLD